MRKSLLVFFVAGLFFLSYGHAFAQDSEEFKINVQRNVGYSSGSQIRGSFTIDIVGPNTIQSVRFLIDGQLMAEVKAPPFSLRFNTQTYPTGLHVLSAEITTTTAKVVKTAPRQFEFATAEQESQSVTGIIFPLLGIIILIMVLGIGSQILLSGRKQFSIPPGTPRKYGINGGSICPRCNRPFALHWWAPNLLVGKYDRCDFCGKMAIMRPMSIDLLRAAEQAEIKPAADEIKPDQKDEESKLRDMLDKSRYSDQ